jgi:hypothetical protein
MQDCDREGGEEKRGSAGVEALHQWWDAALRLVLIVLGSEIPLCLS